MENFEVIIDSMYATLYWRAFIYGMLIPTLLYLVFAYLNYRMIRKYLVRFEAQMREAYNELVIKDLESEVKFLREMTKTIKNDLDKNQ